MKYFLIEKYKDDCIFVSEISKKIYDAITSNSASAVESSTWKCNIVWSSTPHFGRKSYIYPKHIHLVDKAKSLDEFKKKHIEFFF